jgi:hypothetical protein
MAVARPMTIVPVLRGGRSGGEHPEDDGRRE